MPQVPPVEQPSPEEEPPARLKPLDPPLIAKEDIFFWTVWLPQVGHSISATALLLRTSFSNGLPQSLHWNS
jgi:hypothetical protein